MAAQLGQLRAMKVELEAVEEENKGINAGSAKVAKLAGCADTATFSWQAEEAEFALAVGGKRLDLGDM